MRKVVLLSSMVVAIITLLVACGGQQGSLHSTNNDTNNSAKTEESISEQKTEESPDSSSDIEETENYDQDIANNDVVDWSAITANGVKEELFAEKMNIKNLEYVARELQTLVEEEYEDERSNLEILLMQGWKRVFSNEHYKNVIAMGDSAMMPFYWIIYKSS